MIAFTPNAKADVVRRGHAITAAQPAASEMAPSERITEPSIAASNPGPPR